MQFLLLFSKLNEKETRHFPMLANGFDEDSQRRILVSNGALLLNSYHKKQVGTDSEKILDYSEHIL